MLAMRRAMRQRMPGRRSAAEKEFDGKQSKSVKTQ